MAYRGISRSLVMLALTASLAMLTLCPLWGCAGSRARDHAGVPAIKLSTPVLEQTATCGIARLPPEEQAGASEEVRAFFAAIKDKPDHAVTTTDVVAAYHLHWPGARRAAMACLEWRRDSGQIGPDVYTSLNVNVLTFEDTLKAMAHEPVTPRSP